MLGISRRVGDTIARASLTSLCVPSAMLIRNVAPLAMPFCAVTFVVPIRLVSALAVLCPFAATGRVRTRPVARVDALLVVMIKAAAVHRRGVVEHVEVLRAGPPSRRNSARKPGFGVGRGPVPSGPTMRGRGRVAREQ